MNSISKARGYNDIVIYPISWINFELCNEFLTYCMHRLEHCVLLNKKASTHVRKQGLLKPITIDSSAFNCNLKFQLQFKILTK